MPAGQPAYYKTPEELEFKIDEYFKHGVKKRQIVVGKPPNQETIEIEIPTITGLAYFLGFESRQSLYDYGKRDEFSYIIKKAQLFIEVNYEEMLHYGNTTGAIFALKNMGWKDTQHVDHTTKGDKITAPIGWTDGG
jgi:hypothetical protein